MARHYTETEKLGTMLMALNTSVIEAGSRTSTPVATIYEWFNQEGGIVDARRFAEEVEARARFEAHRSVYDEVATRADKLSDDELMVTFRAMVGAGAVPPSAAQAGAQAAAKSELHLHIGEDEIIVPRDDPER